jgi:hypothetical protein
MKKHAILLVILPLLLCVVFSGCDQISNLFLSDEDKIVGTWTTDDLFMEAPITLEFFSNGTVSATIQLGEIDFTINDGQWVMTKGSLTLDIGDLISETMYSYQFSEENKIITLTENQGTNTIILTKQQVT